jgi:hypothetical protein
LNATRSVRLDSAACGAAATNAAKSAAASAAIRDQAEALDEGAAGRRVAGFGRRTAADDVDRVVQDDGAREVARRGHRRQRLPRAARYEAQHVAEALLHRLRLAAEHVDGAALHDGAGGAARFDRRSRRPAVGDRIVDVDRAEVGGAAAAADRVDLAREDDGRGAAFRARQRRERCPRIPGRVEDVVVGQCPHRVAAAQHVNAAVAHDRRMSAARRRQRRRFAPRARPGVVDEHAGAGEIGVGDEAADQVDLPVERDGRRRIEAAAGNDALVAPRGAVEALEGQDRGAARAGSRHRVDRLAVADDRMRGARVMHGRRGAPGTLHGSGGGRAGNAPAEQCNDRGPGEVHRRPARDRLATTPSAARAGRARRLRDPARSLRRAAAGPAGRRCTCPPNGPSCSCRASHPAASGR